MKHQIKSVLSLWKEDYLFQTVFTSSVSALINMAFTIYNGVLGVIHRSIWHGSICVYYLLLAGIRSAVVLGQTNHVRSQTSSVMCQRKIYFRTHIVLLIMNLSLIAPIASMIRGERSYTLGLIPAIAMAAYTIYRITASVLHYRKAKRQSNLLLSELRTINLMDAMVAVLSLQNALIMSKGGPSEGMVTLTAWTSGGILLLIVVIMVRSFMKIRE